MAKLYAELVKSGRWTLEDVPDMWRVAVAKILAGGG
jgi:hypothetical protein